MKQQLPLLFNDIDLPHIEIPLTHGYIALVDPVDVDMIIYTWYPLKIEKSAYAITTKNRETLLMHRIIFEIKTGHSLAKGELVDHIDGNPLNNCRYNLRLATHTENMRNRRMSKRNKTGYKGVTQVGSKFVATIQNTYLGTFDTAELAHDAYSKAAKDLYGEFARMS